MYSFEGAPTPTRWSVKKVSGRYLLLPAEKGPTWRKIIFWKSDRNQKLERRQEGAKISWELGVQRVLQLRIHRRPMRKRNSAFAVMFIQEEIQPSKEQEEEEEEDSVIMYRFSIQYATRRYVGVCCISQSNKNHVRMRDDFRGPAARVNEHLEGFFPKVDHPFCPFLWDVIQVPPSVVKRCCASLRWLHQASDEDLLIYTEEETLYSLQPLQRSI